MELFCSTCKMSVTDDIAVYENVDGYMIHCEECNQPILFLEYGNPLLAGWIEKEEEPESETPPERTVLDFRGDTEGLLKFLIEDSIESEDTKDEECDCRKKLTFTTPDLELMLKALEAKADRQAKAYDKTVDLIDKIDALLGLRQCQ